MKILLVGSTSVIGSAMAKNFKSLGEVKIAGRTDADIPLDLTESNWPASVQELFDVVVHVAADFGGTSYEDCVRAEMVNAVGTLTVCGLAEKCKAKHLILLSTISASYQSNDPYFGIYSLSKRHAEEVAQLFCSEKSIPLTILRPSQVYDAAGECRRHQKMFYSMADNAQEGRDICIYGGNDAWRNYLYLDDLVEISCRIIQRRLVGTFTCAHPKSIRLSEVASAAFSVFGNGGSVGFLKNKPDLPDLPIINDNSLYDKIGYWPNVGVVEGFKRMKNHRESVFCQQ